jgi:dCTP deaminase
MKLLHHDDVKARIAAADAGRLYIDPLLDEQQIGAVSVDLRLGTDFLVSLVTRRPSIDVAERPGVEHPRKSRGIGSYFRTTRRDFADRFILYPGQVVLATTLEYVGLPSDVYADVISRSSYNRLGIHHNTMIQPGFRGCFPLELFNQGNNPIELVVGARIVQARFFETGATSVYQPTNSIRKYYGNVRPVVSRAQADADLEVLSRVRNS